MKAKGTNYLDVIKNLSLYNHNITFLLDISPDTLNDWIINKYAIDAESIEKLDNLTLFFSYLTERGICRLTPGFWHEYINGVNALVYIKSILKYPGSLKVVAYNYTEERKLIREYTQDTSTFISPCNVPCPKCGYSDIYRTHRNKGEKLDIKGKKVGYTRITQYLKVDYHSSECIKECISSTCRCCSYEWENDVLLT